MSERVLARDAPVREGAPWGETIAVPNQPQRGEAEMKVSELIEELNNCDPNAEVHFGYDYGDRSHTTVTRIVDDVEAATVRFDGDKVREVVVLL